MPLKIFLWNTKKKGILHYIFENEDNYSQHKWVTRMARMAFSEYKADWVINNDADEFWCPHQGNLIDVFSRVPETCNMLEATRFNFITVDGECSFYKRMIYRELMSFSSVGVPLPKKIAHRGSEDITVRQGNHDVLGFDNPEKIEGNLDILHFPMRSYSQFANKIKKGGAAYGRNKTLPKTVGLTWRNLFSEYERDRNLYRYYGENVFDQARIKEGLEKGIIIKDVRLERKLERLLNE